MTSIHSFDLQLSADQSICAHLVDLVDAHQLIKLTEQLIEDAHDDRRGN